MKQLCFKCFISDGAMHTILETMCASPQPNATGVSSDVRSGIVSDVNMNPDTLLLPTASGCVSNRVVGCNLGEPVNNMVPARSIIILIDEYITYFL